MRDHKFDFYKGILMFGVIWGHVITALSFSTEPVFIHVFFRLYDMPFFMLLSGMFLSRSIQKCTKWKLLLNKLSQLLFPILLWSGIRSHFTSFTGYYFLWAVLLSSLIILLCEILIKRTVLQNIVYLFVIFIINTIDYNLWNLSYLFPFFLLGYRSILREKYNMFIFIPLFISLICFWNTDYTIWATSSNMLIEERYPLIFCYRFSIGVFGIIVMRWFFNQVYNKLQFSFFINLGQKTLAIYLLQAILVESLLKKVILHLRIYDIDLRIVNDNFMGYIVAPMISVITIYLSLQIINRVDRIKYVKSIFGFKCV